MKKNKKYLIIAAACVVVLAAGLLALLFLLPKDSADLTDAIDEGADISVSTDADGTHQAKLNLNDKGELDNNSYGTLLSYTPAEISKISVENAGGSYEITSYTPTTTETDPTTGEEKTTTDTTQYTLVGYEDFELQQGQPDALANDVAALEFSSISSVDGSNASDFGFDSPRAKATVTYTDDTKAVIYVGDDAPGGKGTYIRFGSGDPVYLVATDSVDALLYNITDMISLTINDSADTDDNNKVSSVTLSGSNFENEIVMEPNTDTANSASYVLTKPAKNYADEKYSSEVTGALRGLYAASVAYVNPSKDQLSKCGLTQPYARVQAVYPDVSIDLTASKPDSEGNVYIMETGGKVVYTMASANLPWVTVTYNDLLSSYVLNPTFTHIKSMTVSSGSKSYAFSLDTRTSKTTDDAGSETTTETTTVKYNGKELTLANFNIFFQNIAYIERAGEASGSPSGSAALTVTYTYDSKSDTDTVAFYKTDSDRYLAVLNGQTLGTVYKSKVNGVLEQIAKVAADEEVSSLT